MIHGDEFQLGLVEDPAAPIGPSEVIEAVAGAWLVRTELDPEAPQAPIDRLLFEAVSRDPDLLRTARVPVGDLLRRCDLTTHRDLVGLPLTDWRRFDHRAAVWDLLPWEDRPDPWGRPDPDDLDGLDALDRAEVA
jgi:hypothetical protein